MKTIPASLYTQKITSFIHDLVSDSNVRSFSDLDDVGKDTLVALGIRALDDVEIVLSTEANECMANYLLTYDEDELINLRRATALSYYDYFEHYFDQMIRDARENIARDVLFDEGFRASRDQSTGEILWRKSA